MSTAQWANIGDDAGTLHALVQRVAAQVAVDAIDYLWIFPARKIAIGESVVIVVGAFDEDPERRRVITARFTISRNRKGVADVKERLDEHGAAPADAVPRIVHGVLRRLGEDAEAEPRAEHIAGDPDRWDEVIVDLGGRPAIREDPGADGKGPGEEKVTEGPPSDDAAVRVQADPAASGASDQDALPEVAVHDPAVDETGASIADDDDLSDDARAGTLSGGS